jgi:hypothetical protein
VSDTTTYAQLAAKFPADAHKTRKQGGRDLTYVTGEMVIGRLNGVLGFDWSFRVVNQGSTEIEAWVLGELTATVDGVTFTRQQYGNQDLSRGQHPTSDLFKSAATDALKKCATTIGVGLYLYDEDERREVEAEMRQAKRPDPTPRSAAPAAPARPATASTPAASGAAPSSSSTTATPAPTPINDKVRDAAIVTGANPDALICEGCMTGIDPQGTVDIIRNEKKERAKVTVASFAPVCRDRLGGIYCGPCYDKRYWKAG